MQKMSQVGTSVCPQSPLRSSSPHSEQANSDTAPRTAEYRPLPQAEHEDADVGAVPNGRLELSCRARQAGEVAAHARVVWQAWAMRVGVVQKGARKTARRFHRIVCEDQISCTYHIGPE